MCIVCMFKVCVCNVCVCMCRGEYICEFCVCIYVICATCVSGYVCVICMWYVCSGWISVCVYDMYMCGMCGICTLISGCYVVVQTWLYITILLFTHGHVVPCCCWDVGVFCVHILCNSTMLLFRRSYVALCSLGCVALAGLELYTLLLLSLLDWAYIHHT